MRDELPTLAAWQARGLSFALATVIATSSSAPRGAGAALALHPDGSVIGGVSGGCVEGAVVEIATEVIRSGQPVRTSYGISDDEALAVGLTCGGTVEVFVRRVTAGTSLRSLHRAIEAGQPVASVTVVDGPSVGEALVVTRDDVFGDLLAPALQRSVIKEARSALGGENCRLLHLGVEGEQGLDDVAVFIETYTPQPQLFVFGAIDFAAAVASIGRFLGYHVTVCDARARFATTTRMPDADEVIVDWPHRLLQRRKITPTTAICVLTHDPKFDVPVLQQALRSEAGYIGVMGSRRTHADRMRRLRRSGVSQASLRRLRSPIGLDLGGRSPQETAVAIGAELVMARHGGTGQPLRATDGPIHRVEAPAG